MKSRLGSLSPVHARNSPNSVVAHGPSHTAPSAVVDVHSSLLPAKEVESYLNSIFEYAHPRLYAKASRMT
eukprot:578697-Amorphochlora_amoeboformis.AAC.1